MGLLDPGKRSPGRKRGIATDTLGLLIAVVVVAASVHDNTIGTALLDRVAAAAPPVRKAWVDAGFTQQVVAHGAGLGIDVEIVGRQPGTRGFTVLPKRWRVEQTLGTLMLHRRLARDYETKPASAVAMIHWSMVEVMARRLTGAATPTWRSDRQVRGKKAGVSVREVLEQIEARRARVGRTVEELREEIARLAENDTAPATPLPPGCREVLAVFTRDGNGLHAKDACQALGTGTEPRHVENMRAKLKRLVERGVLTEPDPGLFVLPHPAPPATPKITPS